MASSLLASSSIVIPSSGGTLPLFCPRCEEPFDLGDRVPIMHSCCVHSTCKACWGESFNMFEEFTCFFECEKPNKEIPGQPKIHAGIRRAIEENIMQQNEILEGSQLGY